MSHTADGVSATPGLDTGVWERTASQPQYSQLKSRYRRFVLPIVLTTLVWYFVYVLLGTYAREFMATPVFGNINVAIILGLSQVVLSFVFATLYIRYANRRLDPLSDALRENAEATSVGADS